MSIIHRTAIHTTVFENSANEGNVDPFESSTHSFIVKIWLEEAAQEGDRPFWRGHITHVPSKERRYVEDLNGISDFIVLYLEELRSKARAG